MNYAADAAAVELDLLGAAPEDSETLLLLGPREPGFWPAFAASPEVRDGAPDPMDRWSKRVIGALAEHWGGVAVFPSDGPPYPPFIGWALAGGQAWQSPVGMLVHARQGLWMSLRGAVRVPGTVTLPDDDTSPCTRCDDRPCRTICPVGALTSDGYDITACKAHLDRPEGHDCRARGCAARRACPLSRAYGRTEAQSRFHMRAFHPE